MNTLSRAKVPKEEKLDGRTIEAQIASWYKPPVLKTVLTQALAEEIAENFLDGFNDEETAEMVGVDPMTLRKWRNLSVIRNHERNRKKFYVHEVRDGKRRDWTRLAWWLERRYPLEFSRPEVAHAISTSIHTTVNTTQNLIVSSELAEQLAERNAKLGAKIDQLFAGRKAPPSTMTNVMTSDRIVDAVIDTQGLTEVRQAITSCLPDASASTSADDMKAPNNPPFLVPEAGTPHVAQGSPTDDLSPIPQQKTQGRRAKGKIGLLIPLASDKNSGNLDEGTTRKNFDIGVRKSIKTEHKKIQPLELEGQVVKTKIQSIASEEEKKSCRATMEAEILRKSRETKLDRAKLRAANRAADKLHPRRAHQ